MAEPVAIQKFVDADLDVDTLEAAVNEDKIITARLGREYASVPMASRLLVENGLLGARPFSTYAKMIAPDVDPPLVDGDYAVVTNDVELEKNGVYQKISGTWVYIKYNVLPSARQYTDTQAISTAKVAQTIKSDVIQLDFYDNSNSANNAPFIDNNGNALLSFGPTGQLIADIPQDIVTQHDFYATANDNIALSNVSESGKLLSVVATNDGSNHLNVKRDFFDAESAVSNTLSIISDNKLLLDLTAPSSKPPPAPKHPNWQKMADGHPAIDVLPWVTSTQLESYYDGLLLNHPTLIAKVKVGDDAYGNATHAYHIKPPRWFKETPTNITVPLPKIVMTSGVHGNEKSGQVNLLLFASNLVDLYKDLSLYSDIRYACEYVIIPAVCPTGIEDDVRTNRTGIDINRDFVDFTQAESRNLANYVQSLSNVFAVIDCHSGGTTDIFAWWFATGDVSIALLKKLAIKAQTHIDKNISSTAASEYSFNLQTNKDGTYTQWANLQGFAACTLESKFSMSTVGGYLDVRQMYVDFIALAVNEFYQNHALKQTFI